jgi:FMN phosphatase YigB (HAD superfamily)
MLTENKGLPENLHNLVWKLKQDKTIEIINDFTIDHRIVSILKRLKKDGYQIACATNSIRETAKLQLIRRGFFEHIDFLYSNQDVNKPSRQKSSD